jgi:cyclopropane fatty-acyl-phospholipid synthase-like methyltransferase
MTSPLDQSFIDSVVQYYDKNWLDYLIGWVRPGALGLHWGYWNENTHSHSQALLEMNKENAARLELRPGMRVLDAGTGIGGSAIWLAATYGVHVVGVSLSAVQVGRATKFARKRGLNGLTAFEQHDFTAMTYPDESFDVVWAQESVCHVPLEGKQAFLREAYRVLKPGGQLLMEDWFRRSRPYSEANERLLKEFMTGWAIDDLATGEEILQWAGDAGFVDVATMQDFTSYTYRSMRRLRNLVLVCYLPGLLLRAVRIRSAVHHGNIRSARLAWPSRMRDLWFVGMFTARKDGEAAQQP